MAVRIAFHTLGCKVNQYETEAMKEAFVERGAAIVAEDEFADVYIVNTCTVTNIADRKSRQYIRRMKGINRDALVVVTGCYAQVAAEEVSSLEEVDLVIGNGLKAGICDKVFEAVEQLANGCRPSGIEILSRSELNYFEDMGDVVSSELGMTRAYVKIQEGCDRFCSYCLIPYARGPVRSRPMEDILREAEMLLDKGFKEIVLTGINTALYGTEEGYDFDRLEGEEELTAMEAVLSRLNAIDKDYRIRFSSLEPTVVDKEHVERIIRYEKLCHHLHLSAQSGSTDVLKTMNRHYTAEEYLEIVAAIREFDPYYGITTDIIVGFPGETEDNFCESLDVIRKSEFGRVHGFRYSPRRGTAGAEMKDAVSGTVKAERMERLMLAAEECAQEFARKCMAVNHRVLTEERNGKYVTGYTDNYIKVYIEDESCELPLGEFCQVQLSNIYEDGCLATAVGKGD
ncbi:MAG: tRNA (N(6)-L-threonylcarbamoyladenosine(37)-C(2))-methylthiotransferase MtaB [Clostridiales bacterium]|nr:tRNA (N(6)-L-threonylcarbamoyladenosine(37)-C(2))-methylthiotransferase MtaB [Candidatus Crickella merdequi]